MKELRSEICGFVLQRKTLGETELAQLSSGLSFGCICATPCGAGRWRAVCLQHPRQPRVPAVLLGHSLLSRLLPLSLKPGLSNQNLELILALI